MKGLVAVRAILAVKNLNVTMLVVDRSNVMWMLPALPFHFLSIISFHVGSLPFITKTNVFLTFFYKNPFTIFMLMNVCGVKDVSFFPYCH